MKQTTLAVLVRREDPRSDNALLLLDELSATLAALTGDSGQSRFDVNDICTAQGGFVIARSARGALLGCGAFQPYKSSVAELKRIYSRSGHCGIGSAIVRQLEFEAFAAGYRALIAGTRASNRRAVALYERNGFSPLERYGFYRTVDARCYFKSLHALDD